MKVVQMQPAHIPGAVALQRACFPSPFPEELLWSADHLRRHLEIFAEGQFVALAEDASVVGSASSLLLSERNWNAHRSWDETTGGHYLNDHDPEGTTLYGADISVHPDWRGRGVGRALYQARFDLVRKLSLTRFGTACRIPSFADWQTHNGGSQEAYCEAVAKGALTDRTLTPLLRYGLRYVGVIHGHMEDDESGDAAAILEWTPQMLG